MVEADSSPHRATLTHSSSVQARMSALGLGYAVSFASASSQFATMADTDKQSFGNGTADSAFSIVALANVTNTAANRGLVSKWTAGATAREWMLFINTSDALQFSLFDESVDIQPLRASDSAIAQGSWKIFGSSYGGTGGATAADGITLYQDGAVIASTPTNNASYVAMENTGAVVSVGANNAGAGLLFDGSLALIAVCAKALTTPDHAAIAALCRRFFGVAL